MGYKEAIISELPWVYTVHRMNRCDLPRISCFCLAPTIGESCFRLRLGPPTSLAYGHINDERYIITCVLFYFRLLFIYLYIGVFISIFIYAFIYSFIYLYVYLFQHLFISVFISSFIYSCIYLFLYLRIYLFLYFFIQLFTHLFIYLFILKSCSVLHTNQPSTAGWLQLINSEYQLKDLQHLPVIRSTFPEA